MRWNAMCAVGRPLCVLIAAGAVIVMLTGMPAVAQAQGAEQKTVDRSYQTIYLTNMTQPAEISAVVLDLRNMLPKARIFDVASASAISVQGSTEDIATAQKIVADIDRPRKAYRLTYTVGAKDGGQRFVLIVTPENKTWLKQGLRVPIVTGKYETSADQNMQMAQYQYQDVGMSIEAWLVGVGDGMRLQTRIEQTSVAEEKSNIVMQNPVIHQSVLDGESVVSLGKPLTLGSVDMPGSGQHMEVQVLMEVVK